MVFEWKKRKVEKPSGNIFAVSGGGLPEDTEGASGSEELKRKEPVLSKEDFFKTKDEGVKFAEEGKFREAAIIWKRIVKNAHGDVSIRAIAEVWEMIAQVYAELGDYLEACSAADECVALEPAWLQARLTRGRARFEFGEIVSASEDFKKIVADCENRVQYCSQQDGSGENSSEGAKSSSPQEKDEKCTKDEKSKNEDSDFSKLSEVDRNVLKEARQELWRVHKLQKQFGKDRGAIVNDRICQLPFWETALKVTYGPDGRPEEESFAHILRAAAEDAVGLDKDKDSTQPDEEVAPSCGSGLGCSRGEADKEGNNNASSSCCAAKKIQANPFRAAQDEQAAATKVACDFSSSCPSRQDEKEATEDS